MNDKNISEKEPQTTDTADNEVIEYADMPKGKEALIKALPLIITLVCVGLFAWGVKAIAGIFYAPDDTHYTRTIGEDAFSIVHCEQQGSNTYYVYDEGFTFSEQALDNVGAEHTDAHNEYKPLVFFTLNEDPLDVEGMAFDLLVDGNGLYALQLDEFIVYRLEGQYGVIAPLREYKQSATSTKNDCFVIRQLLKKERYKNYSLPDDITQDEFLERLEKLEWQLDTEYAEDK